METSGHRAQVLTTEKSLDLRRCFRTPVPEIALASRLLEDAVTAHLLGHRVVAEELIRLADMSEIREWTESIWGKAGRYLHLRKVVDVPAVLEAAERAESRMPSQADKRTLLLRDGYHCRFCDIPLIRAEVRKVIRGLYSAALPWGSTNSTQHAAFQAMWVQYDHVLPHARGGDNSLENFLVTCAACNYGRMDKTLEEVGLEDPRKREPCRSSWDGLERILSVEVQSKAIRIREGLVDRNHEYFELRFGPSVDSWDDSPPVAVVGLADTRTANVQFLVDRKDKGCVEAVDEVWKELHFYLVELNEENPWAYAQHHCGTSANIYSDVHWRFVSRSVKLKGMGVS